MEHVAESALAVWLVLGLDLPAFGSRTEEPGDPAPDVSMEKLCWLPGWEG